MKKVYPVLCTAILTAASFTAGYLLARNKKLASMPLDETEHVKELVHDMKGSVSAIVGYAGALSDGVVPEEKLDLALGVIKSEGERLSQMIGDMLYGGKTEAGNIEELDLLSLARESIILYSSEMDAKGIEPRLVSDGMPHLVNGDKKALFRALSNLVENAVKYSEENTTVTVTLVRDGKNVSLTVKNIGIGISCKDMNRIFDKYYGAKGNKNKGSGIGLHTAADIIRAHNGKIKVSSKKNEYFEITITLKLAK